MISLSEYIEEGLLGGFDEIETVTDPKKDIEQFIKDNYETKGKLQISKEPNENGKYIVNCNKAVYIITRNSKNITSLINGMFEWGEINGDFSCSSCHSLTSLEGAPEKVSGSFRCAYCSSLTSLEGVPKEVGEDFSCSGCDSLKTLEGAPEEVGEDFSCFGCNSLTSLEGAPKEVGGDFSCYGCQKLTSLKGAPKKVGRDFYCWACGIKFKKPDIKKLSTVGGKIKN